MESIRSESREGVTRSPARPPVSAVKAPALLLMAEYNGTLAAARCLAEHGTPVVIATHRLLAPARWSKSVTRVVRCPDFRPGPAHLVEWLVDFGSRHEKHVLYPTCDEMAWLLAQYHGELSDRFHLYSPAGRTLRTVLDKCDLSAAANEVGIPTPRTWLPREEGDLAAIWEQSSSCLVKPRTQAYFYGADKGLMASSLPELKRCWRQYKSARYPAELQRDILNVSLPLIQEYLPAATNEVLSISGFAMRTGGFIDTRACRKILQLPRRAGVGLCFEDCEPDPELVQLLSALCSRIGYFGVFEAEFIRHEGRPLLIDFNPRYFGQLGFDIARGMHLPWLAQLCATGHEEEARQFAAAPNHKPKPEYYADSFALKWHLNTGAMFGAISAKEKQNWLDWLTSRPDRFVDTFRQPGDMGPAVAAATSIFWRTLRHPRGFLRHASRESR